MGMAIAEGAVRAGLLTRDQVLLFAGTTGYGYDDHGRDTLDRIYADIFGTEAALVRIGFVNGTHALSCAMFSAVKAGDTVLSVTGPAYDTLPIRIIICEL